jgi:hypothetical protein
MPEARGMPCTAGDTAGSKYLLRRRHGRSRRVSYNGRCNLGCWCLVGNGVAHGNTATGAACSVWSRPPGACTTPDSLLKFTWTPTERRLGLPRGCRSTQKHRRQAGLHARRASTEHSPHLQPALWETTALGAHGRFACGLELASQVDFACPIPCSSSSRKVSGLTPTAVFAL